MLPDYPKKPTHFVDKQLAIHGKSFVDNVTTGFSWVAREPQALFYSVGFYCNSRFAAAVAEKLSTKQRRECFPF